jgi:tetratricopeptide (TPR) repeat protein
MLLFTLALMLRAATGLAQDEAAPEEPPAESKPFQLLRGEPFDRLTLADGVVIKIVPQNFPEGKKPESPKPAEQLTIELLDEVATKFKVSWKDIGKYEQFQEMVLQDAQTLTNLAQFDLAWDHFLFLRERYPQTPGLSEAFQAFLFANAGSLYQQGQLERALSVIEELHTMNPSYPRASAALGAVAGQVLKGYIDTQKNYRVARQILQRLERDHGEPIRSTLDTWRNRLIELATNEKNQAQTHVAAGNFLEAHEALRRMIRVWPTLPGGAELATEVSEKYPLVVVGVNQLSGEPEPNRLDDWAARRAGRLKFRMLTEYERHGPEGGLYRFPLGQYLRTDDDLQLRFRLSNDFLTGPIALTGYDVARTLQALAEPSAPQYLPAWGQLAGEMAVEGVSSVVVELRRPHVRPEAFLQTPFDYLAEVSAGNPFAPFTPAPSPRPNEVQYVRNDAYAFRGPDQPAVVVERRYEEARQAVQALRNGEIDIIDRLYPADVPRLQGQPNITVDRYDAPSVHLLVPNDRNPFLANRTFRRALQLAIARDVILNSMLLEGAKIPGCRLVSGPFPAGVGANDPQAYAYDFRLEPRPWNLQHAFVLRALAISHIEKLHEAKLKKEEEAAKKQAASAAPEAAAPTESSDAAAPETNKAAAAKADAAAKPAPPKLGVLKLVYPATEIARRSCQAIQLQLKQIQIEVTLEELPPGKVRPDQDDFDLLYAEVSSTEPLVDARRILGEGGVAKITNPYIRQALRDLDAASTWREARSRLLELHERVHTELVVIPLWQIIDHYAYRANVQNMTPQPAQLYQDIEQWRIVPRPLTE